MRNRTYRFCITLWQERWWASPFRCHPSVSKNDHWDSTPVVEQSWYCGNLCKISQECRHTQMDCGSAACPIPFLLVCIMGVPMTSQTIPNVGCYWRYHPLNNPISSRLLRPHVDQWLGHSVNDKLQPMARAFCQ